MLITIYGIDRLHAAPDGFAPLFDFEGRAYQSTHRRLLIPRNVYQLAEGIEAGTQNDPRNPGMLGGRWYQLGDTVAGPLTVSLHTHQTYTSLLRRLMWTDPEIELPYAQQEPFWDISALPSQGGIMGPESVARLAADYRANPDIDAPESLANFHKTCGCFIQTLASHKDGAILIQ